VGKIRIKQHGGNLDELMMIQQMMIDLGERLIHSSVGNPYIIATDVELLGEN